MLGASTAWLIFFERRYVFYKLKTVWRFRLDLRHEFVSNL